MLGKESTSFWFLMSALALTIVHSAEKAYDIVGSLNCYTDYITKIDCQWTEDPVARRYIPMGLYYKKVTLAKLKEYCQQKCNLRRVPGNESSSDNNWYCTIKEDSYAIAFNYRYVFKPEQPINLRKSFRLLETLKPQPPLNLSVAVTETGDYLLTWQTVYTRDSSNMLFGKLQYEINYRRTWESWEDSVTENVPDDNQRFQFGKSFLATLDTYLARVRAKPQQHGSYRGVWSAWSSEIQWDTTEDANVSQAAEAAVMPRNLQCAYDGIQEIECTWEVTEESSKYFEFNLHYGKTNSSETKECQPSVILHTYSNLTVHRCNIPVDGQEALENYTVFLKLAEPAKTISPYKNIKANPPSSLTVQKLPDGRYKLSMHNMTTIYDTEYEVNYKKVQEHWKNAKVLSIPQDTRSFVLQKESLDASSKYCVRVRAKVIGRQSDSSSYFGPWGDWSKEITLETDPDTEPFVVLASVVLVIMMVLSPPFFCLIKRKKRSWLDSIPDPAKSKLFHKDNQKGLLVNSIPVETVTLEEGQICQVTNESSDALPQVILKDKAEFAQTGEKPAISSPLVTRGSNGQEQLYQEIETATATETELSSGEEFPNHLAPLSDPSDYDGPYLFNYQDFSFAPNSDLKKGFDKSASYFEHGQGAPGYVKLPQNSSVGLQALDLTNGEQEPPLPTSPYVLNPLQPTFSSPLIPSPIGYHARTDDTARACLSQSVLGQPSKSPSSYVLCPPLTNSFPIASPEVITGHVHTKDADISGLSQPPPGSDTFASQRSTVSNCAGNPLSGCSLPMAGDKNAQDPQSCRDFSRENHPTVAPWQPGGDGYVLTPAGEHVAHLSVAPELPQPGKHEDQSLSAGPQQGIGSEALIRTKATDSAPELPYPSKFQADTQKPTIKKQELPLPNILQNEAINVILYQQGAKPILLQQIGDYCFIPGSCPTNTNRFTNTEPVKKHSVFHEDVKGMPPLQSPYTTINNVRLP